MSRPGDNGAGRAMKCAEAAPLLPFYACDELEAQERERVAGHVAACAGCAAQLVEERALLDALAGMPQPADRLNPSDLLLSQCRSELAESLDDLAAPPETVRWQPFGWLRRLIVFRPAWSAAALLLLGIVVGTQAPDLLRTGGTPHPGRIVRATPRLSDEQLSKMAVAGINFAPSPDAAPGTVQLQLRAEEPLVLSGSIEDADVRRVLTYVVENGQRFDAGVRLDCLDALKAHSGDADVRRSLQAAARRDANPAVRLKALDALRPAVDDAEVRETLLDALENDQNPGVRVEAVNLLAGSLQTQEEEFAALPVPPSPPAPPRALPPPKPPVPSGASPVIAAPLPVDPSVARVLRALEELARKDPNRYVRLRSAAALRQIGPRETH
ncbi:MAG: hypothetical protein LAN84_06000 [Acidobacteriia bacterium]|nr:hypothetical protein [Terriglobia bacterium]